MSLRLPYRPVTLGLPLVLLAGVLSGVSLATTSSAGSGVVQITTVSNRADLISGDDALVRITAPGADPESVHVRLNGQDITAEFQSHSAGGLGLISGLRLGDNTVTATAPDGRGAELTITNHPLGGPVIAGPQIEPWTCSNNSKSPKCYADPTFAYTYVGTDGQTHSYDPKNPPQSFEVASTTTTDGVTVPFIYRTETGYIDRDQYSITALWQPGQPWTAWSSAMEYVDYLMLLRYWQDPSRWDAGDAWTPAQMSAVLDHPNVGNPVTFTSVIPNGGDPTHSCSGLPKDKQYDPKTNKHGVRC